jgi:hypothetical protein
VFATRKPIVASWCQRLRCDGVARLDQILKELLIENVEVVDELRCPPEKGSRQDPEQKTNRHTYMTAERRHFFPEKFRVLPSNRVLA